ncbi:hypothetical protein C815_01141 [Firmicutes bacterium M10-2]|nr:hypothetical protein C815_01141 [Firmicutes bacterium M10-2]
MKTNKQKYKETFSSLTCIEPIVMEERKMQKQNKFSMAFTVCALILVLSGGTICYANDIGGIKTIINGWFHGEKIQVNAVKKDGIGYDFYKDGEEEPFMGGGGVTYDEFGNEVPLSAEDVLENSSKVIEKQADGKVVLYDHDLSIDITDYLKDGKAKLIVVNHGTTTYWNIEVDDYSTSFSTYLEEPDDVDEYVAVQ